MEKEKIGNSHYDCLCFDMTFSGHLFSLTNSLKSKDIQITAIYGKGKRHILILQDLQTAFLFKECPRQLFYDQNSY